jgi:hypothetical protein
MPQWEHLHFLHYRKGQPNCFLVLLNAIPKVVENIADMVVKKVADVAINNPCRKVSCPHSTPEELGFINYGAFSFCSV